jgi:GntR family transcriptional regulator / MocR family aminotransferase
MSLVMPPRSTIGVLSCRVAIYLMMKTRLRTTLPTLALERQSSIPIYRQVYEGYRRAILTGQLAKNVQMPSTRELASELRISRNSVMNAFDQLRAEGYIRGEHGSGTFVEGGNFFTEELHGKEKSRRILPRDVMSREATRIANAAHLPASSPPIPFRRGLPALDEFPLALWSRIVTRCCRKTTSADLNYTEPQGYLAFRHTIAEYLRNFRAVKCDPDQIFVVSGSQQGLQLIAHALLNDGESVCMEDPGYPGARSAFLAVGANILPVPVDDEGMEVSKAIQFGYTPKHIYVTPSHQFPLGVTMSIRRRLSLLDWAEQTRACVIEDDYDSEYRFVSRPLSSLQGLRPESVIYVGTFSKAMFPSMRLGYVIVPPDLVRLFTDSRRSNDFCAPFLTQAAMNEFIVDGHFARHLRRMRALYAARQSAMLSALRGEFGEQVQISNTDTGMDLVLWLPKTTSDATASQFASKAGIITMPMSFLYSAAPRRSGLFLGFGAIDENQIKEAAKKLRRALVPLLGHG